MTWGTSPCSPPVEAGATLRRGHHRARRRRPRLRPQAGDRRGGARPRIYPSGAMLSQTGATATSACPTIRPRSPASPSATRSRSARWPSPTAGRGAAAFPEQLRQGASQVKLMAGGGVASPFDPLDVTQYIEAEVRAAVEAAENWGTYVAVHAYTPRAIRMAVAAGVKSVEHGHLIDAETAALLAERGSGSGSQPFLDDADAPVVPDADRRAKLAQASPGRRPPTPWPSATGCAWPSARTSCSPRGYARQGRCWPSWRGGTPPPRCSPWPPPATPPCWPCPAARPLPGGLGVVREGALADLLLVDGDPLADLGLLADPERNLAVIMKAGRLVSTSPAEAGRAQRPRRTRCPRSGPRPTGSRVSTAIAPPRTTAAARLGEPRAGAVRPDGIYAGGARSP